MTDTMVWLLGPPRIECDGQPRPPRGQKSWAVLARVALSERPVGRAELAAELFAGADDPLGALRWCLADLRRCLGQPALLRGDPIGLAPELAAGDAEAAVGPAGRAAGLDPLDEDAQELFLRAMVAAGHTARATVHLTLCETVFAREGLPLSPATRAAVRTTGDRPRIGVRAGVVAASLLRAGTAALDAGSVDAGIETLRRAAEEAERSADALLEADVLRTLGSALVHALRGFDGEGAVLLHRAMAVARRAGATGLVAEILRELAFVDVQAGRHTLADRALAEAERVLGVAGDPADAGILAIRGMNEADRGRHTVAATLLATSAGLAAEAGAARQAAWSHGVLARSLLLAGRAGEARAAAERSVEICERERWNTFLPWSQSLRAECLTAAGQLDAAQRDAEEAFALACELGDPCWEGMAARALALNALRAGDPAAAEVWIVDARRRCDRFPDRYVWVSAYVGLAHLEIAAAGRTDLVAPLAARLRTDAVRHDLPEFVGWALVHLAETGEVTGAATARAVARDVVNPALHARIAALGA